MMRRPPLTLALLEGRDTPATFTWDGGGADDKFSDKANWAGDAVPPIDGTADLIFPAGTPRSNATNDLGKTSGQSFFASVTMGAGMTVSLAPFSASEVAKIGSLNGDGLFDVGIGTVIIGRQDGSLDVASQFFGSVIGAETAKLQVSSSNSVQLLGPIELPTANSIDFGNSDSFVGITGDLAVSATISGNADLVIDGKNKGKRTAEGFSGSGELTVQGASESDAQIINSLSISNTANDAANELNVQGGTVVLTSGFTSNGSARRTSVTNGGVLRGNGEFGDVTISSKQGGVLAPGNADLVGTMTFGKLTLPAEADTRVRIIGTSASQFDRLVFTTPTTLNGKLSITAPAGATLPNGKTIIIGDNQTNTALSGTFTAVSEGKVVLDAAQTVGFRVSYKGGDGNDLSLTTVARASTTISLDTAQTTPTKASPINLRVTFSQPVAGFAPDDVVVTAGSLGTPSVTITPLDLANGRAATYRLSIAGLNGTGPVQMSIGNAAAQDADTLPSLPSNAFTVALDNTPPTAKLSANTVGQANNNQTTYTFTTTYSDTSGIAVSTIRFQNVRITGPNGFTASPSQFKVDVNTNGTPRVATYTLIPPGGSWDESDNGVYTISQEPNQVTDTLGNAAIAQSLGEFTVQIPPRVQPPLLVGDQTFAVGSDVGASGLTSYDAKGTAQRSLEPFGTFTGGVRTATGDFNSDGVPDVVVGTGPGRITQVLVLSGADLKTSLFSITPFESTFTGGVYVSAGDVSGDGVADLVITPDEGGGPRARVFSGKNFNVIADFLGIDDPNFRGGARSAIGDMNGDRIGDLVVVAGFGGGPRVAGYDGKTLSTNTPTKIFNDFFAFEQSLRNGVFVTVGDVNGDGFADLITGGGPGGGPRVTIFSASDLKTNVQSVLGNFFAGDVTNRGGVRLAVKNLDGDAFADVLAGSGAGAGSRVTSYLGRTITPNGVPPANSDFTAFFGFNGGVFVG